MEIKSIICPNCGANTTNAENCEYCGSLLVRFVDKGIDLSKTSFTNDTATFPGLAEELKRNLKLQNNNPNESVVTDLLYKNERTGDGESLTVWRSGKCFWYDNSPIDINNSKNGLIICIVFDTYVGSDMPSWKTRYNYHRNCQLEKFKKLDCFPLFTSHISYYEDEDGDKRYSNEYAIDFGNDAEGAARLLSEILQKVYGRTQDRSFDMYTEVGHDNYLKARTNWNEAHGFNNSKSLLDYLFEYWWVVLGVVCWLLFKK